MSDIEISEIVHTRDVASEGRRAQIALIGLAVVFLLGVSCSCRSSWSLSKVSATGQRNF